MKERRKLEHNLHKYAREHKTLRLNRKIITGGALADVVPDCELLVEGSPDVTVVIATVHACSGNAGELSMLSCLGFHSAIVNFLCFGRCANFWRQGKRTGAARKRHN